MSGTGTLHLAVRNDLAEVSRVTGEITVFGEARGWAPEWISRTCLALDELIVNAVSYGQLADREDAIRLRLEEREDCLVVVMEDDGVAFDPFADAPAPDLDAGVDERPVGGLGLHLVRTFMRDCEYRRDDGVNRVTLVQGPVEE